MNRNKPLILDDDFLPQRLRIRLQQPLPGRAAQRQFAHELSYGRHFEVDAGGATPASTAIVLMRRDDVWQFPLTLRSSTLPSHAGQICLPGGGVDPGETDAQACLREVEEELRIPRTALQVLGALTPLYLYVSNYRVTPFVTFCTTHAPRIDPNPDEVAKLIWLPVAHLVDPAIRGCEPRTTGGGIDVKFAAPHFAVGEHFIWGATAMMLSEFAAVLDPRLA